MFSLEVRAILFLSLSVATLNQVSVLTTSMQQLSYYFPDKTMWQSFVCAMTAAVCLQAFDPFRSGKLVLYQTKYSVDWHGFEIIPYALLGIFGVGCIPPHLSPRPLRWDKYSQRLTRIRAFTVVSSSAPTWLLRAGRRHSPGCQDPLSKSSPWLSSRPSSTIPTFT